MDNSLICVIEDNAPIRRLFCTLLKKSGFETIDFPDGTTAYEWLKNNRPAAVLLDILLPDLNGTELILEIRKLPFGADIPVIAVTGFAQAQDRDKYIELGFNSYISKPINTATFANDIKMIFNNPMN